MFRLFATLVFSALVLTGCAGSGGATDTQREAQADTYIQLAMSYMQQGDLEIALGRLEQARRAAPDYAPVYNALGLLYDRMDEPDNAESAMRKAVSLKPDFASAHNNFGRFLCARERYEEAQKEFAAAYNDPLYIRPWFAYTNAGICAREAGNGQAASAYFRAALRGNPKFAPALLQMARVKFEEKQYLETRAYLERLRDVSDPLPETLWMSIQTEYKLGDFNAVASHGLLLRSKFPDSDELGDYERLVQRIANERR